MMLKRMKNVGAHLDSFTKISTFVLLIIKVLLCISLDSFDSKTCRVH